MIWLLHQHFSQHTRNCLRNRLLSRKNVILPRFHQNQGGNLFQISTTLHHNTISLHSHEQLKGKKKEIIKLYKNINSLFLFTFLEMVPFWRLDHVHHLSLTSQRILNTLIHKELKYNLDRKTEVPSSFNQC